MAMPVTRYAKSGKVHIAYQAFGSGPNDLVFVPGFISHIENYWDQADLGRWLLRLAAFARVIMFDKRGTGLSDPVAQVPPLELRMDDVRAVMDAAGKRDVAGRVGRWRAGRPVRLNLPSVLPATGAVRRLCALLHNRRGSRADLLVYRSGRQRT
jgi:pimeloyl-ACP methyl ester carboxylesterase